MSYASLRNKNNDISNLRDKFNKLSGKGNFDQHDETYWSTKHIMGPDGKGTAVVRFLPAPPDGKGGQEPDNIVRYFQFAFRGKTGKWYINRGRNSISHDEPDPANDYNAGVWQMDISKEQKKKLLRNRQTKYIANIYVVSDPNKPENEGKVFRWEFGPAIYNLIHAQLFPEFETDSPVNVFDPIDGADFELRVISKTIPDSVTGENRKVPSYENARFAPPSQRWDLEEFDKIWNQCHSLQSEVAPDKYKTYEQLCKEYERVTGEPVSASASAKLDEQVKENTTPKETKEPMEKTIDDEIPMNFDNDDESSSNENQEESDSIDDWFDRLS